MEKVIFTNMTVHELETIIIDCVLVCLKSDDRKKELKDEESSVDKIIANDERYVTGMGVRPKSGAITKAEH